MKIAIALNELESGGTYSNRPQEELPLQRTGDLFGPGDGLVETPYSQPAFTIRSKTLKKLLAPLDAMFPLVKNLELGPYVHWSGNASTPMHRWLRYREAYSPELIDKLSLGRRILDPFCGCGSIPIGAATRHRKSLGIDLNPLAAFSTRVKLTPLNRGQLSLAKSFLNDICQIVQHETPFTVPDLSIAGKVFEPDILDAVLRTRTAIEHRCGGDLAVRNFVLLAWLSVLETVGSYFKEGNGIKYRNKKRQKGRYTNRKEGEWQVARFGIDQRAFFADAFSRHLEMMLGDTVVWNDGSWDDQTIVEGSAFDLARIAGQRKFDSVIFSPPYANRFDYFESFKVELWFGSFVKSYEELNLLRKASLRSHLNADYTRPSDHVGPLEELIALMDRSASSWRMGVADLVRGYFHDLRLVLEQCREVMPRGRCHVVVGNSAFAGVIIPTDVLTAMVGKQAGFKAATIVETRHLTVSPQQRAKLSAYERYMRESIVVLE